MEKLEARTAHIEATRRTLVRLSFPRVPRPQTHRAEACIRCQINRDAPELLPLGSGAYRKRQEMLKRRATRAIRYVQ